MKKKVSFILIVLVAVILTIIGLPKEEKYDNKQELDLRKGSIMLQENEKYYTYYIDEADEYKKLEVPLGVVLYNDLSDNYFYMSDGKLFVNIGGENKVFDSEGKVGLKIAPNGKNAFYFKKDKYLQPFVVDLNSNKEQLLENKILISGQMIQWINERKLIYYGVDNERKISGLYVYDVIDKSESLITNIPGYVQFMKWTTDGVLFLQKNNDNKYLLRSINSKYELNNISDEFTDIKDVHVIRGNLYILGKMIGNSYSIYEIVDGKTVRLTYDFPKAIDLDKGFSEDNNGKLLFAGNNGTEENKSIYSYMDGTVSKIFTSTIDFNFVDFN